MCVCNCSIYLFIYLFFVKCNHNLNESPTMMSGDKTKNKQITYKNKNSGILKTSWLSSRPIVLFTGIY